MTMPFSEENLHSMALPGISKSDNPLSFFSLLGLLRSLDRSKKEWYARASWNHGEARLHICKDASKRDVVRSVVSGLKETVKDIQFGRVAKLEEFVRFDDLSAHNIDDEMLSSLMTEGIDEELWKRNKKKNIADRFTPLYLRRGNGQLYFLNIIEKLSKYLNVSPESKNNAASNSLFNKIYNALFEDWHYEIQSKMSLCWDTNEHAPSAYGTVVKDGKGSITTVGPTLLGIAGFTAYTCLPVRHRPGIATVGCTLDEQKRPAIRWPLWVNPLSYFNLSVILSQITKEKSIDSVHSYGIESIMESAIFVDGKYRYMLPAQRIA